jgi:hypothetical protein
MAMAPDQPAILEYDTPEFRVVRPGAYVLCAVSGKRIPLSQLLYWDVERQEAYAGPAEYAQRLRGPKAP